MTPVSNSHGNARVQVFGPIKAKYDPQNLFRVNQNIAPAKARGVEAPSV